MPAFGDVMAAAFFEGVREAGGAGDFGIFFAACTLAAAATSEPDLAGFLVDSGVGLIGLTISALHHLVLGVLYLAKPSGVVAS